MLLRLLLVLTICGGLFHLGGLSVRHLGIIGFYLYVPMLIVFNLLKDRRVRILPLFFILSLIIFCLCSLILIKGITDVGLFERYFSLSIVGLLSFGLITTFNLFSSVDLEKLVVDVTIVVIVFAVINLTIIAVFPKPFVVIALLTNSPVEDFVRLYDRILMPFGHPAQLGLVAASSALAILSFEKTPFRQFLVLFSLITVLGTFANSIFIPCFLIGLAAYLRKIIQHPIAITYFVFFGGLFSLLLLIAPYQALSIPGRDMANIAESASRHLILRIQTLGEISEFGLTEMLVGVGAGQSRYFIDGSYSFTVILTQMFEGGILLVLIQIMYFLILAKLCGTFNSWAVWWLVFMASFFYQINNDISFYIYPLICILAIERTHGKNPSKSGKSKGRRPQKYISAISSGSNKI